MSLNAKQLDELRDCLQRSIIACAERCLYRSSKWSAELLSTLPEEKDRDRLGRQFSKTLAPPEDPVERRLEVRELPKYLCAKSFFDCREFKRCASVLLPTISSVPDLPVTVNTLATISQKSFFLALYALMLSGEKSKAEHVGQVLSRNDQVSVANEYLPSIKTYLQMWFDCQQGTKDSDLKGAIKENMAQRRSQGWLEYLYGMVLVKDKQEDLALDWPLTGARVNPWNWGAWQEVCHLIRDAEHLRLVHSKMSPSIMGFMFSVYCRQELQQPSKSLVREISKLQDIFHFLRGQLALVHYHMRDVHAAEALFSQMLALEPRNLDFWEDYSNVLYTLGDRKKLAFVGELCSMVDRYRPETSCVVGNYYSLTSRHQEAVVHFKRALLIDRHHAASWSLLGHEFLQLENPHAAIECYRRAVNLNRNDYRAFVGLGQVYYSMDKPDFASFYYRRATRIRPQDPEWWQSLANCLTDMDMLPSAIVTLERSLRSIGPPSEDSQPCVVESVQRWCKRVEILYQLGKLHVEAENRAKMKRSLELCLEDYNALVEKHGREEIDEHFGQSVIPLAESILAGRAA